MSIFDDDYDDEEPQESKALTGFAPAGIKAGDSDSQVLHKWQIWRKKNPDWRPSGFLFPKRVLMAILRQGEGDEGLAALGLTPDLIREFNRGHLTQAVLLAVIRGPQPCSQEEREAWPKLTLAHVGGSSCVEIRLDGDRVTERQARVLLYLFDIEGGDPDYCMVAATRGSAPCGEIYVLASPSWLRQGWTFGAPEVYALVIPKGKKALFAASLLKRDRRRGYENQQMRSLIEAWTQQQRIEERSEQ